MNKKRRFFKRLSLVAIGLWMISAAIQADQQWSYTYNRSGLMETADGPRTDVSDITTYAYNASGHLTSVTNALGHITQYIDYNSRGQPGKVIDPNGVETVLAYHARGWLLSATIKDPGGNTEADAVTQYEYDAIGQVRKITLPDNRFLIYEYDAANRLTAIENASGERIEYTLDEAGNRTGEIVRSASGDISKTLFGVYDELSRLMVLTGAAGQSTQYRYDVNDNNTEIVDGKSNPTGQLFDALNRLTQVTEATAATIGYAYDSQDRLTKVTDQRGLVTRYHYDAFDNLTKLESPDTGTTVYTHDNAGNIISKTDARGVVTQYQYDALNRVTAVIFPANPSENITYIYDRVTDSNYGKGRLTRISDATGWIEYVYDHLGRIAQKRYKIEGVSYSLAYAYDRAGNLTQITYPSGRLVYYSRNGEGRVSGITTQANATASMQTVVSEVDYLPFGPVIGFTYGNGVVHTVVHDLDYRVQTIRDTGPISLLNREYHYDANNNITALNDQNDSGNNQLFDYDPVDRLKQASGGYGEVIYRYDAVGNRTQRQLDKAGSITTEALSYDVDSNHLTRIESNREGQTRERNFQYDATGNQVSESLSEGTILDLTYNDSHRLTQLDKDGDLAATYLHNALGQRVAKTLANPVVSRHFHYDESGLLVGETQSSGQPLREIVYLNGIPVAVLVDSATVEVSP